VGFLKGPAFNRFSLDGGVGGFPSEPLVVEVKQGHRRFAQYKGIFGEGLVVLGTDIAVHLLRPVKEFGGKDLHAAIQRKAVEGGPFRNPTQLGQQVAVRIPSSPRNRSRSSLPSNTSMSTIRPPQWGQVSSRAPANADGDFTPAVP